MHRVDDCRSAARFGVAAFDTKVMSASNSTVYNPKLPIGGEVSRHSVTK